MQLFGKLQVQNKSCIIKHWLNDDQSIIEYTGGLLGVKQAPELWLSSLKHSLLKGYIKIHIMTLWPGSKMPYNTSVICVRWFETHTRVHENWLFTKQLIPWELEHCTNMLVIRQQYAPGLQYNWIVKVTQNAKLLISPWQCLPDSAIKP